MNRWFRISGRTGSGKTAVLEKLEALGAQVLNLEKLALHKGSVFGGNSNENQPSQKQFETQLNLKILSFGDGPIFFESKPELIGVLKLPQDIKRILENAQTIYIDTPIETRKRRIFNSYGKQNKGDLLKALLKLQNRLDTRCFITAVKFLQNGEIMKCIGELLHYYDNSSGYSEEEAISLSLLFRNEQQTAEELYQRIIVEGF